LLETAVGEIKAISPQTDVTSIVADIAKLASVESLWKEVAEKVGKIDVLVNNAGKATEMAAIGSGDVDNWWSVQVRCFLTMETEHQLMKLVTIANQPLRNLRNDRRICRFALGIWQRRARNNHQCLFHD